MKGVLFLPKPFQWMFLVLIIFIWGWMGIALTGEICQGIYELKGNKSYIKDELIFFEKGLCVLCVFLVVAYVAMMIIFNVPIKQWVGFIE